MRRFWTISLYFVFLFLFSFVALGVLFGQVGYSYNLMGLFALTGAGVLGFVLLFRWLSGKENVLRRIYQYEPMWLPAVLTVFLMAQLLVGWSLRFESAFDFAAVYKGAVSWAETGTFAEYYDYFDWFPNNLGAMTFLAIIFKGAKCLGLRDYFFVGVLANSILVTLTLGYAYLTVRKLSGKMSVAGIGVLLFFLLNPAFYVVGAAFYTDSLSMLFPIVFYYYYLCLKEGTQKRKALVYMSFAGAVGVLIKSTVLIMVVAVLIEGMMRRAYRRTAYIFAGFVATFVLLSMTMNGCLYSKHLDKELARQKNTPIVHWVMMGLNSGSQGAYNNDDYVYTRSFDDPQVRDREIVQEICRRLKEGGFSGTTRLLTAKLTKAFGDGTFALSDFLDDGPVGSSWLHRYVLYESPSYYVYKYATQVPLLVVYGFVILGAWGRFRKMSFEIAPYVAVLGLIIFLAFWESSSRYYLNYVPVLYCLGGLGLERLDRRR